MKIIIDTSKNNSWIGRCGSCKSIITASSKDIDMKHVSYADNGKMSWNDCPVCGASKERTIYYVLTTKEGVELIKIAEEIMSGDISSE
jgi:hypothetical protein